MPEDSRIAAEAAKWVQKAEEDYCVASRLSKDMDDYSVPAVCFHSQQAVEKYVKALLVAVGIHFRKTHEIEELINLLPEENRPDIPPDLQGSLTEYAVAVRYPSDSDMPTRSQARAALRVARKVRTMVRRRLHMPLPD
jgi:HEPN domain-containing protein